MLYGAIEEVYKESISIWCGRTNWEPSNELRAANGGSIIINPQKDVFLFPRKEHPSENNRLFIHMYYITRQPSTVHSFSRDTTTALIQVELKLDPFKILIFFQTVLEYFKNKNYGKNMHNGLCKQI